MTIVPPSIATEEPNASPAAPSEAVSSAVRFHEPDASPNTAAPHPWPALDPTVWEGAPTHRGAPRDRHRSAEPIVRSAVRRSQLRRLGDTAPE